MHVLVLGAGATGGYFGGRLAEAGAAVTFLVRPPRAARLAADGLVVVSPKGDIRRPVAVVTAAAEAAPADVVLLSCKAYDLETAIAAIAPAVEAGAAVLPVLNGLRHLDRLDEAFGAQKVLGGLAQITATLAADGRIRHLSPLHRLVFGARQADQADLVGRLAAVTAGANFDGGASDAILQEMWEKHAFIATLAGATCLMRGALCDILAQPGGEALILGMQAEGQAIAAACAMPLRDKAVAAGRRLLTDKASTMAASMLRDLEAGQRTEADHILGDLIDRGRAAGLPAPLLALAHLHLGTHAARQARQRAAG